MRYVENQSCEMMVEDANHQTPNSQLLPTHEVRDAIVSGVARLVCVHAEALAKVDTNRFLTYFHN